LASEVRSLLEAAEEEQLTVARYVDVDVGRRFSRLESESDPKRLTVWWDVVGGSAFIWHTEPGGSLSKRLP
jgi:hypothetical protein